jgi:preprotein translocase subunit SecF
MVFKLVKENTSFDFLSRTRRNLAVGLSTLASIASLIFIFVRGLNFGIDFTGGVLLEVGYPQDADVNRIPQSWKPVSTMHWRSVLDRQPTSCCAAAQGADPDDIRRRLQNALAADEPGVVLRRVEFVGPQVGEDLSEQGFLAIIFALLMIFAYVMFRFQWKFAAGAVLATIHDVVITVGVLSIFWIPFDLSVVAAVLAVIGYSLNDTVVTFDRIRENFIRMRATPPEEVINKSVNQVLSRTIITGITTLMVLFALLWLGGESVGPFSIALIVGILVGTYSSIFTASAITLYLNVTTQDLLPPAENPDLVDDLP